MAGRGFAPGREKDATQVRRRNKPAPVPVLVADGKVYGPELPNIFEWPDVTRDWWQTWRTSAQAATFTGTDWSFLIATAVLHAEFFLGNRTVAGELRLREAKLGATAEDRARLKFSVGDAHVKPTSTRLKAKADSQRLRLLKAVSDGG
jgi:hypothetical protein